jgi:hypothetical protein
MAIPSANFWKVMLSVAAIVFITYSGSSYLIMSDGFGFGQVNGGITRIGAPLVFWKSGGFNHTETFSLGRLLADMAFALAFGLVAARKIAVRRPRD